jgi:hypothetical protein
MRRFSPAGYQRRQGANEDVETGEALDVRRGNPVEETAVITLNGKDRGSIRVADRVAVPSMGVQQNAPGGKGPDRWVWRSSR